MHDRALLRGWVAQLPGEQFQTVLPLVRRSFGTFTGPERAQIGQAVAAVSAGSGKGRRAREAEAGSGWEIDDARARPAVQLAARLLGFEEVSR